MSFYATVQGSVVYPDAATFDKVVAKLQEGGWLDSAGYFLEEAGARINEDEDRQPKPNIDRAALQITVPWFHYHNLSSVNFFPEGVGSGRIIGTSSDGVFEGWTIINGVKTDYDLEDWAIEGDDDDLPPDEPEDTDDDEAMDEYHQDLCNWQMEIENQFHEEFGD